MLDYITTKHNYEEGKKTDMRSSRDLNLGLLNVSQTLLPLSQWSFGIEVEDRWCISMGTQIFRLDLW